MGINLMKCKSLHPGSDVLAATKKIEATLSAGQSGCGEGSGGEGEGRVGRAATGQGRAFHSGKTAEGRALALGRGTAEVLGTEGRWLIWKTAWLCEWNALCVWWGQESGRRSPRPQECGWCSVGRWALETPQMGQVMRDSPPQSAHHSYP